ncbi:hypothetical protein ACFLXQ_04865 [Chloroflexota bacterium]
MNHENQIIPKTSGKNETALDEAQPANNGFHHTLLSQKHYLIATATGLLFPLPVVYFYRAGNNVLNEIFFYLTILCSTLYLFATFKKMLLEHFNFRQIRLPTDLLFFSLTMYLGLSLLGELFLHHPYDLDLAKATFIEKALYYATLLGSFGTSTALILISFELENLPHKLYGLLKPFRYVLLTLSLFLLLFSLAIVNINLSQVNLMVGLSVVVLIISEVMIILTYTVNCLLLSFIFLFAAFRGLPKLTLTTE